MRQSGRRRLGCERLEQRALLSSTPGGAAAGEGLILPDLLAWESASRGFMHDYVIEGDLLRFTTSLANAGAGDLELRAGPVLDDGTQQLLQRVERSGGGFEDLAIEGSFTYHPTHDHIHFDGYAVYHLRQITPDEGVGPIVASGGKVSFCLLDVTRYLPGGRPSRFGTCGSQVQGVTGGWADVYDRHLPDQWINISGIPDGEYWLEVTVDPDNLLLESDESNNTTRIRVDLEGGPANQGDRYESNDTFATATNLGMVVNRQEPGLSLHVAEDTDFYHLTAAETGELTLTTEFTHSLGDIDVRWYDGEQQLLNASHTTNDVESIVWQVAAGDDYYIEIYSADGRANSYELILQGPGNQQILHITSTDTNLPISIPDSVQLGTPGPAAVSTLQGPDVEIQDVNLILDDLAHSYVADLRLELTSPNGTTATIIASGAGDEPGILQEFSETEGFLQTRLDDQAPVNLAAGDDPFTGSYNASHSSVGTSPLSVFNGEQAAGTWQLRITDWAGQDTGTLVAWSLEFTASLVGDRYEPNNDVAQAVVLEPAELNDESGLSIHAPGEVDYFRLATTNPGHLGVHVFYDAARGAVDVTLLDSDRQVLAQGQPGDDSTLLLATVAANQLYYVRVSGAEGTTTHYALQAQVRGDANGDAQIDSSDIDELFSALRETSIDTRWDLDWNGTIDAADADVLVRQVIGTEYGDTNLDHVVDAGDFQVWNAHRFANERGWSQGNFNGDTMVDGRDFHVWLHHRFAVGASAAALAQAGSRAADAQVERRAPRAAAAQPAGVWVASVPMHVNRPDASREDAQQERTRDHVFGRRSEFWTAGAADHSQRFVTGQRPIQRVVGKQIVVLRLRQADQQDAPPVRLSGIDAEKLLAETTGRRRGRQSERLSER